MYEVEINGTDYTDKTTAMEFKEGLGQIGAFKLTISDMDGLAPTDIVENKVVRLKLDGTQFFKGLITRVTYTSSSEVELNGLDMGVKLLNRKMDRYQATNRAPTGASPSILTDIVSENQDGTGGNILNIGTNTSYGASISFRCEHDNRLRGIAAIANTLGWDWWIDQDIVDNDQINIHSHRGSTTSVFTFTPDANCAISRKERDMESMVNWITMLGYGDGINQIKTDFFAASNIYTTLSANCSETDTTISCVDLSSFPAGAGYFKIGSEYVYGTKSGNNIGVTATGRGIVKYGTGTVSGSVLTHSGMNWMTDQFKGYLLRVNSVDYPIKSNTANTITVVGTPASGSQAYTVRKEIFEHYKGCVVFEYDFGTEYTPLSPKTPSPIDSYGVKETRVTRKDIINLPTLELFASKYMLSRATPVERNIIIPDEPEEVLTEIELGDVITLNDANAGFASSQYRCVGRCLRIDFYSGKEELEYEVNDKAINFVNDPVETKENTDTLSAYMDGATNIYCVSTYENGGTGHPISLRFYVPPEAVAINHVKISFKMKDYRAYNSANQNESAHTHNVGTMVPTSAGGSSVVEDTADDIGYKILDSTYRDLATLSFDSTETAGAFVFASGLISSWDKDDPIDIRLRIEVDGVAYANYYMSEMGSFYGSIGATPYYAAWYIPENVKNKDVIIQAKDSTCNDGSMNVIEAVGFSIGTHAHAMGGISAAGSAHTHGITYGIYEESLSSPSVDVTAGVDGSETTVGTYTSDQNNLDITVNINTPGAWHNVIFTPNKNMRIEANAYVQVFLKST